MEDWSGAITIEDNSPAAEALRANAEIRVSQMGKAARAVRMNNVGRLVKKSSYRDVTRGKPPRLPPSANEFGEGAPPSQEMSLVTGTPGPLQTIPEPEEDPSHSQNPNEEVIPGSIAAGKKNLRYLDPHGFLKVLRRKRRKKSGQKSPKSYVKGKVIDGQHELYILSIAVMIGLRTSISRTNVELSKESGRRWIKPADFKTTQKYEFHPRGSRLTPAHQLAHTFKFKDYAPLVFAYLRRMSGVNEFDFLLSVSGNANFIEFISNAKSGQFFFYSNDGRFMIKTMTNAESKFLRRILPQYFKHCAENPNTMITRFFGMYRVKLYHLGRNVKFVVMNSVYFTDKYLQSFYDLKGSVIGRDAKPGQAVKKDNDLRRLLPEGALALSSTVRHRVAEQVKSDCDFLTKCSIMDYSMLVGIHHVPVAEDNAMPTTGFRASGVRRSKSSAALSVESGSKVETDHSYREGGDFASEAFGAQSSEFTASIRAFYDDLEEDDDDSYLVGSDKRRKKKSRTYREGTEMKKAATVEKLYWPFHQWFDITGSRLLTPAHYATSLQEHDNGDEADVQLDGYDIPKFVTPLSDRKDGGLEMETSGLTMPMIFKGAKGDQQYRGKIFYMGIIDILQEFNARKVIEAKYRLIQSNGKLEASCVNPKDYGKRFVDFFDEYTRPVISTVDKNGVAQKGSEEHTTVWGRTEI